VRELAGKAQYKIDLPLESKSTVAKQEHSVASMPTQQYTTF